MKELKKNWTYAYQSLQSELIQITKYMERCHKTIPAEMVLSEKLNPNTTPEALSKCITAANYIKNELSSIDDSSAKITTAFITRFVSDAEHFNADFLAELTGAVHQVE